MVLISLWLLLAPSSGGHAISEGCWLVIASSFSGSGFVAAFSWLSWDYDVGGKTTFHKTVLLVSVQFPSKADLDRLVLPPTMISQLAKVISPLYFKTPTANYFLLLVTGSGNRSWRAEPGDPIIFIRFPFNSQKLQRSSHFLKDHPVTSWQDKDQDLKSQGYKCGCCWPF